MEGARKLLADRLNEPAAADFILEKLRHFLHFLAEKYNQILPAETRSQTLHHWAHVGLTVVLPVSLVLLCLYHCCCGGIRLGACLRRCCCCCCCCCPNTPEESEDDLAEIDYLAQSMMRAPGRNGAMMPRDFFERNPRGYFRDLRAKKDLPNHWY